MKINSIHRWMKNQRKRQLMKVILITAILGIVAVMLFTVPSIWTSATIIEKAVVILTYIIFVGIGLYFTCDIVKSYSWKVMWTDTGTVISKSRYSAKSILRGKSNRRHYLTVRLKGKEVEALCEPSVYNKAAEEKLVRVFSIGTSVLYAVIE